MKYTLLALALVFAIAGLAFIAAPDKSDKNGLANAISGDVPDVNLKDSYDFGAISMKGGKVNRTFSLEASSSPMFIKSITTSCMCTSVMFSLGGIERGPFGMPGHGFVPPVNETIPAGQKANIIITFDPNAHGPAGVGKIERVISVEADSGPIEFRIKALVTP